jgi:hypothetical protein
MPRRSGADPYPFPEVRDPISEPNARIERVAPRQQDPPVSERRKTFRSMLHDVVGTMVLRGHGSEITYQVKLLNISGAGAAVLAEEAPRLSQPLRLTLPTKPAQDKPIDGHVIETSLDPSGGWVVHIRFVRWLPLGPFLEAHRERRLWERYPVRESRASVTWREGATEKSICGDLLNICGGGAAFLGDDLPPSAIPIWLQLEAGVRQEVPIRAVEGRILMSSFDPSGRRVAHIKFVERCPTDFFDLATQGSG